jgi:hypothetical protein
MLSNVSIAAGDRRNSVGESGIFARFNPNPALLTSATGMLTCEAKPAAGCGPFRWRAILESPCYSDSGTISNASSHAAELLSAGARQSPRGDSDPPDPTLGAFGIHDRLNWLN